MDTSYTLLKIDSWNELNINLFTELLNKGEVEVKGEDLQSIRDNDGFFRINGRTVLVYIRDQYQKFSDKDDGYKYHLMGCKTIDKALNSNRKSRYVAKNTSFTKNDTPEFLINIIDKEKSSYFKKNLSVQLKVCKNCLTKSNHKNYSDSSWTEKKLIYQNFNYKEFFDMHETSRLARLNFVNYNSSAINEYTEDFKKISYSYRSRRNWMCEKCKFDCSEKNLRKYLHTHHIDHHKARNKDWNLKALCIICHSNEPRHQFMKNSPAFRKFVQIKEKILNKSSGLPFNF